MKGRSNDFEEMSNILQQKLIELMEQNQTLEKCSLKKTTQLENLTDKCKRLEIRLGKLTHELKMGNERNRRLRNELISCSSKMKVGLKSTLMGEIKTVENSLGTYMTIKNNVLTDQSYRLKILENPIDHERKCLGTPIVPKWPRCNIRRTGNTRQLLGSAQKSKNDYYQDENSGSSNSRFVKECEGPSFSLNDSTNSLKLEEVVILSD
ncbi:unnamed protein product [Orchesella dallaii]|uniref:Uncharacterized protein n=1 Tax=Orchesella dallaii TaxID=48710 RepID=A0ABP1S7H7_9HEXA